MLSLAVVQDEQASTVSTRTSYSALDGLQSSQLAPVQPVAQIAEAAAQQLGAQAAQTHGPAKASDYLSSLQVCHMHSMICQADTVVIQCMYAATCLTCCTFSHVAVIDQRSPVSMCLLISYV